MEKCFSRSTGALTNGSSSVPQPAGCARAKQLVLRELAPLSLCEVHQVFRRGVSHPDYCLFQDTAPAPCDSQFHSVLQTVRHFSTVTGQRVCTVGALRILASDYILAHGDDANSPGVASSCAVSTRGAEILGALKHSSRWRPYVNLTFPMYCDAVASAGGAFVVRDLVSVLFRCQWRRTHSTRVRRLVRDYHPCSRCDGWDLVIV
jgi:hypothetical protein